MSSLGSLINELNPARDLDLFFQIIFAAILLSAVGAAFATLPVTGKLVAYLVNLGIQTLVYIIYIVGIIGTIAFAKALKDYFSPRVE